MPTPTFLRDLASDVLNGRVSATSALLAYRLVEQAEALEGATADGYEVPPFPFKVAPVVEPVVEPAPSLVWHKEADPADGVIGIHLCLPNGVSTHAAPYSYFDADEYELAFSEAYTSLGAKTHNCKDVGSRLAGLSLLVEWARADGYVAPAIPIEFLEEPVKEGVAKIKALIDNS